MTTPMTIDETIKFSEEVAEELEEEAVKGCCDDTEIMNDCYEWAKEHRRLAAWLKELKKWREIPDKLVPKYRDGIRDEYDRGANEMLEEVIDDIRKYIEEVNTDAKFRGSN